MGSLVKKCKKFKRNQDGTATIEFVLLFPAFMFLFLMGFESGYYMVRSVMLERAVDVAVRDVRLANGAVPELSDLKKNICDVALIMPNCVDNLQVEVRPIAPAPGGVLAAGGQIRCIDTSTDLDDIANSTVYDTGSGNQLMLVRVCALAQPMFPTTGIGAGLRYDALGNYAMVATTAFVNEPEDSTARAPVPIGNVAAPGNGNGNGNGNGGPQGNNGHGNGDQDAPGNSLDNNGAENDQTPGGNGNGSNGNSGSSGNNGNGGPQGNNGHGNGDQDAPGNSLNNNNAENDQTPGGNGNGNSNGNGNGNSSNNGNGNGNGNGSHNGNAGDDDDDDDDDGGDD